MGFLMNCKKIQNKKKKNYLRRPRIWYFLAMMKDIKKQYVRINYN